MADKDEKRQNTESDDDESIADKGVNIVSGVANNAVDNAKNIASDAMNKTSEEIGNALEKTKEMLNNPSVLYGLIGVIIIAIICVIVIYYFIANSVFNKKSIIIEKTKFPIKGNISSDILIENFPASGNGKRRTYTFWVYVNDVNNAPSKPKHIFSIGESGNNYINKSPVVFLKNSILYVYFPNSTNHKNIDSISNTDDNVVYFDYLPMQRWVHIAVVISDDYRGATVALYMDAQLVKSITNNETIDGTKKTIKELELDKTGKLLVGGDNTQIYGFNGLLSKVGIHNYDLNSRDIYNIYSEGPIDGMLASLGYGVRSPIYKLSE